MENRIKEQLCLFADRLSTETMRANQLRMYLSAMASRAAVFYALLSHMNKDGAMFPSQERIASESACGKRTVQDALKFWEDFDIISWKRGGKRKPNRYAFHSGRATKLIAEAEARAATAEQQLAAITAEESTHEVFEQSPSLPDPDECQSIVIALRQKINQDRAFDRLSER
jgi:hypothetical protein